jgi:hypothetical protein
VVWFDVALSESNIHRWRPGKEGENRNVLATNWLLRDGYCRYDAHDMRQRLGNEGLHDYVGRMAQGTIGLQGLTDNVGVSYLHDRGAYDECAAKKAKRYPEGMTVPLIGSAA